MIIGLDPGPLTGCAVWHDGALNSTLSGQYPEDHLFSLLRQRCDEIEYVQAERFVISARTIRGQIQYEPLLMWGSLRHIAWECGFPLIMSQPSDVMTRFPDAVLKHIGWHTPGHPHQNDACRHLLLALVRDKVIDSRDLIL